MTKRARPHVITLRVNDAELALIEDRMQQAGIINREAYLRRAAINCYLLSMKLPEVKALRGRFEEIVAAQRALLEKLARL